MKKLTFLCVLSIAGLMACHNQNNNNTGQKETVKADSAKNVVASKNGITISYFVQSPEFADARLEPVDSPATKDKSGNVAAGEHLFKFKVSGFKLTDQTPGAATCDCNNSNKGQHIHQILNGAPYVARYKDTFYSALTDGHYVNLCFLSRSYHESVKNKNAFVLSQFNVGKSNDKPTDLTGPLMFYSRPKGEYKGEDAKNLLLDFYLVNTDLSPDGNKVKATINGTEFMLTKWAAYSISGLPMGENTVKLELVDKDNKPIPGPYNTVERKIKLSDK